MKSKKIKYLILTAFILCLSGITFLIIYLISKSNTASDIGVTSYPISFANISYSVSGPVSYVAANKYISADLPSNWSIKEYYDNSGMESATLNTEYSGFTGFEIYKNNKLIFSLKGLDGIGGNGGCGDVYRFSDTDPKYIQAYIDSNREMGLMQSPPVNIGTNIVDINDNYIGINLFKHIGRLVKNRIYWNSDQSNKFFNPLCGLRSEMLAFDSFFFATRSNNYVSTDNKYQPKLVEKNLNSEDLQTLAHILNSLKYVK